MRQPDFWWRSTPGARIAAAALAPLGFLYGASVAWKRSRSVPYHSRIPVICIGNLTVGGSGKTPVAIAIATLLQQQGISPAFLLRGYGGMPASTTLVDERSHDALSVGDEALLLARVAPTIVSADRAGGAHMAEAIGAQVIIMDDGYQNFSLHKDLSIVVVDGETCFGNGRMIPAGPLREPVEQGLRRADAVVVIGKRCPHLPGFAGPMLLARLSAPHRLDQRPLLAFAGIGRPEKFFATLREAGATLVETHAFADHHVYSNAEVARLRNRAIQANSTLITTEKDLMRLPQERREGIEVLPVRAIFDAETAVAMLMAPVLARASATT